ncbi:hypothetical protein ACB087_00555 [Vibrio sp. VNB-15]
MNALEALLKASSPNPKRIITVDHFDGRKHRNKVDILKDAKAWNQRYLEKFKDRGLSVGDDETIAIRLTIVDKLTDLYELSFPDALKVVGLVDADWQEFAKAHYGGHKPFMKGFMNFPVLWDRE